MMDVIRCWICDTVIENPRPGQKYCCKGCKRAAEAAESAGWQRAHRKLQKRIREVSACDAGIYEDVRAAEAAGLSYGQYKIRGILDGQKK